MTRGLWHVRYDCFCMSKWLLQRDTGNSVTAGPWEAGLEADDDVASVIIHNAIDDLI